MTTAVVIAPTPSLIPAPLSVPTPKAAKRLLEFFSAQVNNDHRRKACLNATKHCSAWCEAHGLLELATVEPFHLASLLNNLVAASHQPAG